MRKVLVPIYVKLVLSTLLLLSVAIGVYAYFAVDLFKGDKIAYVFESVNNHKEQLKQSLEDRVQILEDRIKLAAISANARLLRDDPNLLGYKLIYQDRLIDQKSAELIPKELGPYRYRGEFYIHMRLDEDGIESQFVLNPSFIGDTLKKSDLFSYELINKTQDVDRSALLKKINNLDHEINFIFGEDLVSFTYIDRLGSYLIVKTSYDLALQASQRLREQSIYFAFGVLGLVIFLAIVLSRNFTVPIRKLFWLSERYGENDFEQKVKISSRDELGVLGDALHLMGAKIQKYMLEMKEKTRLEQELMTAKLVQKSFFPLKELDDSMVDLASLYRPASECGGDWYGIDKIGESLVIVFADVTGHGTPAALMTAMLHNSFTHLKKMMRDDPSLINQTDKITEHFNWGIKNTNSDLLATFFAISIDFNQMKLFYTNASHNPPLLMLKGPELSKGDLLPLNEALGPRLGEKQASYEVASRDLRPGERLLFYTDGGIEAQNSEGTGFGNRRFYRLLIENIRLRPQELLGKIEQEIVGFTQGLGLDDDMSLICLDIKS